MTRSLYAQVKFVAADGTEHEPGDMIDFQDDSECLGLMRHGVLGITAPRRQAGQSTRTEQESE